MTVILARFVRKHGVPKLTLVPRMSMTHRVGVPRLKLKPKTRNRAGVRPSRKTRSHADVLQLKLKLKNHQHPGDDR